MLWKWSAGLIYLVLVIVIVVQLFRAREHYVYDPDTRLDAPQRIEEWQEWREKARTQKEKRGDGNVKRRLPSAEQSPTLILLRDRFPLCLAGAIFFASMLYWVTAFLLRGMFRKPSPTPNVDSPQQG